MKRLASSGITLEGELGGCRGKRIIFLLSCGLRLSTILDMLQEVS